MTTFDSTNPKHIDIVTENDIRRGQEYLREITGETCEECRGIIATAQTASWVYKERTICDCKVAA